MRIPACVSGVSHCSQTYLQVAGHQLLWEYEVAPCQKGVTVSHRSMFACGYQGVSCLPSRPRCAECRVWFGIARIRSLVLCPGFTHTCVNCMHYTIIPAHPSHHLLAHPTSSTCSSIHHPDPDWHTARKKSALHICMGSVCCARLAEAVKVSGTGGACRNLPTRLGLGC